jgi:hypothetical protein
MNRQARLAALCVGLAWSACTCEPEKAPLPEGRVNSVFVFEDDAFSFANFGGRGRGSAISPASLERLHGKVDVCEPTSAECRLTALAKEYMRSVNEAMEGGRCEGFAILSGLASTGAININDFGAAKARELSLEDSRALGAELAYWFATQYLADVVQSSTQALSGEDAVRVLGQSFAKKDAAPYRIGIARVDDAGYLTGGHAVLATAVGPGDDEGTYFIYVYDNNLPDSEKKIVVDVEAGTWEYLASTNPDDPAALYRGTPENGNVLFLAELQPRKGQHPCAFCNGETPLEQVFGSAGAIVTVEDESGAQAGEVDGKIVNEAEGSRTVPLVSANNTDRAGTLTVLPRQAVRVAARQGQPGAPSNVRVFGPNLMVAATNLSFGDDGTTEAELQTNDDGTEVAFAPADGGEGCSLTVGTTNEDGEQTILSVTVPEGEQIENVTVTTDDDNNPTIDCESDDGTTLQVKVVKSGEDGEDSYAGTVEVPPEGSAKLLVDEWDENGGDLGAEIDEDGDGVGDQTVVVDETEPLVPPVAPTNLTASARGTSKVSLTWEDNAADEVAYEVERDDGDGFERVASLAEDTTAYLDRGLAANTLYSYRVRAVAPGIVSEYSNVATATTDEETLFSVAGAVDGLAGVVVLKNRGTAEELTVAASGPFTFLTEQTTGETYDVAVVAQPRGQRCTVTEGLGVITADVTDVVVSCVNVFPVGGEVRGLSSGGLILENNGVDPLSIDDNGPFTFTKTIAVDTDYDVTVVRQPPGHFCVVEQGEGIVTGPVNDVLVLCERIDEEGFTVSVSVTGLGSPAVPGVVLQNNAGDDLAILADGTSTFATALAAGAAYDVTVLASPEGVECTVQDGQGVVVDGDVTVEVSCARGYRIGGTMAGLNDGGVARLSLDRLVAVDVSENGAFVFPGFFATGTSLAGVTVLSQPEGQRCSAEITTDVVAAADVTDLSVVCVDVFTVGGTIDAPSFANVVITEAVTASDFVVGPVDTSFVFEQEFLVGDEYEVYAQGDGVTCEVTGGTGTVSASVTDIAVTCTVNLVDFILTNPSPLPDVLPADEDLSGVEFDVELAEAFSENLGTPGPATLASESGDIVATGTWRLLEEGGDRRLVRITFATPTAALDAGDYTFELSSVFSFRDEPAQARVVTRESQPLRVLPRGLVGLEPNVIDQGDETAIAGVGVSVFGDAILLVGTAGDSIFRGILTPSACVSRTQAGCLLQQAPFIADDLPAGTYDVCVVPGVDPENLEGTLPASCPGNAPTLTINAVRPTVGGLVAGLKPGASVRLGLGVDGAELVFVDVNENGPFVFPGDFDVGAVVNDIILSEDPPGQRCFVGVGEEVLGTQDKVDVVVTCAEVLGFEKRSLDTQETAGAFGFDGNGNQYVAGLLDGDAFVVKLNLAGEIDPDYGDVGFAAAQIPASGRAAREAPGCMIVQATGHVIIATAVNTDDNNELHAVRFSPLGTIDASYGGDTGTYINDSNPSGTDFAVQGCKRMGDGRVVIGASFYSSGANARFQSIWRLDANGAFNDDSNVINDPVFDAEEGYAFVPGPEGEDTAVIVGQLGRPTGERSAGFLRIDNNEPGMFVGTWTELPLGGLGSAFSDAVLNNDGSFVAIGATFDPGPQELALGLPRQEEFVGGNLSGTNFVDDCPAGQVPIGFHAELGDSVDGLAVVCGTLVLDLNAQTVTVAAGDSLPLRGGPNATQVEPRCPADTVLVGFSGRVGALIDRVDLQCAGVTLAGDAPTFSLVIEDAVDGDGFGGNGGAAFAPTACGAGEVARGVTINAGSLINNLALRCSTLTLNPGASVETPRVVLVGADDTVVDQSAFDLSAFAAEGPYRMTEMPTGGFVAASAGSSSIPAVLLRIDASLQLDVTFGDGGALVLDGFEEATSVEVDPSGGIVVVGTDQVGPSRSDLIGLRFRL